MPVTQTSVRIPMPPETTGSGLAAMLSSARGSSAPKAEAQTPSAPASEQSPSGVTAPAVAPSQRPMRTDGPAPKEDFRSPGAAKRPPEGAQAKQPLNHNDPQTAANGKFTIDENGRVVPAGPRKADDSKRAPDPDDVDFTEDESTEKPTEAKVEATAEKPTETPAAETPAAPEPLAFTQTTRDYSVFDPVDVEALKKLPNAAFNRFRETFVAAKKDKEELETLRKEISSKPKEPVFLYEHPEAYMLQKDFTNLLEQEDQSNQLVNFYQTQLARASEGEDIQIINGQGQLQELKLNGRVNGQVMAHLQVELNKYVQFQQQAKLATQQYQSRYKQQVATIDQQLKQIDDKFFPGFSVDKLTPEEKAVYEEAYRITPEPLRNSPQTRHLAQAYVSFAQLHVRSSARIAELEKQLAAYTSKATPMPKPIPAGQGSVEDTVPYSVDD
jgi:hypothetical protein